MDLQKQSGVFARSEADRLEDVLCRGDLVADAAVVIRRVSPNFELSISESCDQWLCGSGQTERKHISRFVYSHGEFALDPSLIAKQLGEFYDGVGLEYAVEERELALDKDAR